MSNNIELAINEIKERIAAKESEILPMKITVNELCKLAGLPEEYNGASMVAGSRSEAVAVAALSWRSDQFFGRPLATCVVEYFEARKKAGLDGPATIDEVYEALTKGGFKFEGTSGSEANTKRAIKISLTKNTAQFVKVNDDLFALKKWYNMRASRKASRGGIPEETAAAETAALLGDNSEEKIWETDEEK